MKSSLKIGIACYPSIGGSGIVATELGHELAERGHEVHFITYDVPFRLDLDSPNIHYHEVKINHYDLFKYPDYALTLAVKMANIAQERDLDILHVHYAIPHATSAFLAKQIIGNSKPVVITTLHGTDITLVGCDPAFYQVVKFSIEQSDGVTAVSENLKKRTQEVFQTEKEIEVIYNFFTPDPQIIGTQPLREQFVQHGEKLILHTSNFRMVKRPQDVVQVFAELRKQLKCKLLLLGTGVGLEEIRRSVAELQLQEDVFFVGENRFVDPYVASADLFLLPSSQESFGLAALEAMAYGVPVVATDVGGIPELVSHGISGLLAKVGDIPSMVRSALQILSDDDVHQRFSGQATREAKERFCASKMIPLYEAYYATCIATQS